jgi:4-hydroxybenzoate polyprenyltransferase
MRNKTKINISQIQVKALQADLLHNLLKSMRPVYWVKNTLVFTGLIFSFHLFQWEVIWRSLQAFCLFCMASSGVYLLNDLCDIEDDRWHPKKRFRPLASGDLNPKAAQDAMGILIGTSLLGGFVFSSKFGFVLGVYLLLNILYSFGLKKIVVLDAMIVAVCFILRAIAGALVVDMAVSIWLVLCTFSLGLFLSFGKRWHELKTMNGMARNHRKSLQYYTTQMLYYLLVVTGVSSMIIYTFYTMAPDVVERFNTLYLPLTIPFVIFGIFRYIYLARLSADVGNPVQLFITDRPQIINSILWIISVCLIIYGNRPHI